MHVAAVLRRWAIGALDLLRRPAGMSVLDKSGVCEGRTGGGRDIDDKMRIHTIIIAHAHLDSRGVFPVNM